MLFAVCCFQFSLFCCVVLRLLEVYFVFIILWFASSPFFLFRVKIIFEILRRMNQKIHQTSQFFFFHNTTTHYVTRRVLKQLSPLYCTHRHIIRRLSFLSFNHVIPIARGLCSKADFISSTSQCTPICINIQNFHDVLSS